MGMRMRTRTGFVALMALWIAAGCAPELYGDDDDGSGLPCGGIAGGTCEGDEFCDYRIAVGLWVGAGVAVSAATYLWLRGRPDRAAPTVAIGAGGAAIGYAGSF